MTRQDSKPRYVIAAVRGDRYGYTDDPKAAWDAAQQAQATHGGVVDVWIAEWDENGSPLPPTKIMPYYRIEPSPSEAWPSGVSVVNQRSGYGVKRFPDADAAKRWIVAPPAVATLETDREQHQHEARMLERDTRML